MAVKEMTLTQALVEKKTLESRIEKLTKTISLDTISVMGKNREVNFIFCDVFVGKNEKSKFCSETEEESKVRIKAQIQKIEALISNYQILCKAINKANNETTLTIAGKEMTIVEAIALKSSKMFSLMRNFANKLATDFVAISTSVERINKSVNAEDAINNYLSTILGEDRSVEQVEQATKQYHETRDARLFDPANIKDYATEYQTFVENFEAEVDFKLSEINAITKITVEFED